MAFFKVCAICKCALDPGDKRICSDCEDKKIRQGKLVSSLINSENGQMKMGDIAEVKQ